MTILAHDCGCSLTKTVLFDNGMITLKTMTEGLPKTDIKTDLTAVTGINAKKIKADITVPEFEAQAAGASFLTGLSEFLLVCVGTGTSFVNVNPIECKHLGGTGLGGGTVSGLSKLLLSPEALSGNDYTAEAADKLAALGEPSNIDILMKDILRKSEEPLLPRDITVSNFGKINPGATDADLALGICKMVFESILMMTVFAVKNSRTADIPAVFCGTASKSEVLIKIARRLEKLQGMKFIFPTDREYIGAIGAALTARQHRNQD
ncbi:MAG: hypothetical protein LBM87_06860 [Ruminococcus sp.]|jgi:type II pantothenate kinase|nr:hypothetical protein [Ruminococcus sp.]